MTSHTDLLNFIAEKIDAKTYLEIGVFNPDHNFRHINVRKWGVDPDPKAGALFKHTSDFIFDFVMSIGGKFDLIFIDGLHHAEQVQRDIINAWECLNVGGVMVIHDCNPPTEATTCVPRGAQREWCGDVYKAVGSIDCDDQKFTMDFDYGCCVIRKSDAELVWDDIPQSWEFFEKNRKALLTLISVEKGIEVINSWEKITEHAN